MTHLWYSKEAFGVLVLLIVAQITLLRNWQPILLTYKHLPDIVWQQDDVDVVILPLGLPTATWSSFGKVVGTQNTIALAYTQLDVSASTVNLAYPSTDDFCGTYCNAGSPTASMIPGIYVKRLTASPSAILDLHVPFATDAILLSDLWNVATIRFSILDLKWLTRTSTTQLWSLSIDNVPSLGSITPSFNRTLDRKTSLSTLRFTPRRMKPSSSLDCLGKMKGNYATITAGHLDFVLAEDVGCSKGTFIQADTVGVLGRVGGPNGHNSAHFLSSGTTVDTCLQVGSGAVLCRNCSVAECLTKPIKL